MGDQKMQAALNIENAILWIADDADFNDTSREVEFPHVCGYVSAVRDLGLVTAEEASQWFAKASRACDKADQRAVLERKSGGRR